MQLVFDKPNVSDPNQTAAANDAENFVKSIRYGIVKQDTEDAAYKFYSEYQSPAFKYAKDQIKQRVDKGFTISGEMRFTDIKVEPVKSEKSAVVTFCSDSSKLYSKEVKTKKVHHTEASLSDFDSWQVLMTASDSNKGLWRAKQVEVATEAKECR